MKQVALSNLLSFYFCKAYIYKYKMKTCQKINIPG